MFSSTSHDGGQEYWAKPDYPMNRGLNLIKHPRINKGMGFSLRERQQLGIHGLLPPAFMNQGQQAHRVMTNLRDQPNDLARYVLLNELQDRNEKLFYRVLIDYVEELMPIVYTPTVGLACQEFGYIYRSPKGLYITINDNDPEKIYQMLSNWPERDVKAIVVTDGERILGLGDLGAYGMGIPVGKLALYVALAGVQPRWYLEKHFGQSILIQFEDFGNRNAFRLLDKYKGTHCTFNDDIQGTASVAVAGLLASERIIGKKMTEHKLLFFGAGEASLGIALLSVMQMQKEGLSFEEACDRVVMIDSRGLIVKSRTDLTDHKKLFAKDLPSNKDLMSILNVVKPTILIGAATIPNVFTEEVIRTMSTLNERPVIFALSNPTDKAECTAEAAYKFSQGKVIFASGSPFDPVTVGDHTFHPGQGNNAYIFPGVALATIMFRIRHVDDQHFLIASQMLADLVSESDLNEGRLYPSLTHLREISIKIAVAVGELSYEEGTAEYYPEPDDKEVFIMKRLYTTDYDQFIPPTYDWPVEDMAESKFVNK